MITSVLQLLEREKRVCDLVPQNLREKWSEYEKSII